MAALVSQAEAGDYHQPFDEIQYAEFFRLLTGREPYQFQTELAKTITTGQSVILRAPTGSGKTWATIAPFIYSCLMGKRLADRMIYVLPLRSLASNIHQGTRKKLEKIAEFCGHISSTAKNRRYVSGEPFYLGLQMGGQQNDPFFEGDIVFTTIDQLLSAYLFAPVSLPDRIGNIGAGALIGSFLVFDEIHLLDPQRSLATTIEMLNRLRGLAQFVLMTATMPDSVMKWMSEKLGAQLTSLSDDEVLRLPSHSHKQREFEWRDCPLSTEDIVGEHRNRTIAIVNTVARAQELFRDVRERVKAQKIPPQVFLLHSRFFPEDRNDRESKLGDYFGPEAKQDNAILISTQVVEAGIDISADALLTELAPLNSLLQRAGRVARYPERNIGRFLVFDLPTDEKGRVRLGPYRDVAEIIAETRKVLVQKKRLPLLDYAEELEWLRRVHEHADLEALAHLNALHNHAQRVLRAMDGLDDATFSRLVRETSSVSVVLTKTPDLLRFSAKEWPELLSVPRTSLYKLKEVGSKINSTQWVFKVPEEVESESNQRLNFKWCAVDNPARVAWLVAINPLYASYSPQIGLELGKPSNAMPDIKYKPSPPVPRYSYQKESFVTHAKRVADQGSRILAYSPHALSRLKQRYSGLDLITISMVTCALHDAGKLQVTWQDEAERWQQHIDDKLGRMHESVPLAHTDFDPERDFGDRLCNFPPHAACGGFALLPYFLEHCCEDVARVLCTVITRHHGTHTSTLTQFELTKDAGMTIEQCLPNSAPRPVYVRSMPQLGDLLRFKEDYLLHITEQESWWPLYASVVRIVRLADQGSFQG